MPILDLDDFWNTVPWKGVFNMKIGSVNGNIGQSATYGTDAHNRAAEVKIPVREASVDRAEVKAKSQAENVKEQEVLNEEMLNKAIAQANKSLESNNRLIERSVHDVTHTVMYTVKDTVTDEVIAEFPPKKIQDMIAKMWELAGLFVDEKA